MARPKNDQPGPSAKERMANAFWETIEEKPYEKITVKDIVERAHLNRNAFYYHFQNMDDLAQWTYAQELPTEIPRLMFLNGTDGVREFLSDPVNEERIRRVRLAIGDHGSKMFRNLLKDAFIVNWCKVLGIDPNALTMQQRIVADFVVGGVLAVASNSKEIKVSDVVQFLSSSDTHEKLYTLFMMGIKVIC